MVDSHELLGQVGRITYRNPDTGWTVMQLELPKAGAATVVGALPELAKGESVALRGQWAEDPRWGRQFQASDCRSVLPSSKAGIVRLLGSGLVPGIGPRTAERLVAKFGDDTLRVLDEQPERLRELRGLGRAKCARIAAAWKAQRQARVLNEMLLRHDVTPALARRIEKRFGAQAERVVRTEPYRLAIEVTGIGFLTADRIAREEGVALDSPSRAQAGLLHVLGEAARRGHVLLPQAQLLEETGKLLGLAPELLADGLVGLERAERIVVETVAAAPAVYLEELHAAEIVIADRLRALAIRKGAAPRFDPESAIAGFERERQLALSPGQREAVRVAAAAKVMVLTGGPGTGKTTIVSAILAIARKKNVRILLASPTGRAAKRLQETTGLEARTIHRLLEWNPHLGRFSRHRENPLEGDLLVVDEASMLDVPLAAALLDAVPDGCRLVFVGDEDQLPSVGPGRFLADLVAGGAIPTVRLTEIHRQARGSRIVETAHRVLHGEFPTAPEREAESDFYFLARNDAEEMATLAADLVARRLPQRYGLDPRADIQLLVPMNRGPLGTARLNRDLQALLTPDGDEIERGQVRFRVGDRILQLANDYEREVFNGDTGWVVAIDKGKRSLVARFDERELAYGPEALDALAPAWAMTIHKAQGSEYPAVVVLLHTQHFPLLQRNLLYTALTRGKRLVVLVASHKALGLAVANARLEPRLSGLLERLREAGARPH